VRTRSRLAAAAAVFVVAFAVYLRTLAPTVGLIDSGELTAAAWTLGNAHAPGFPFYLLVTRAVMLLPIGSIAVRANVSSALFAALAAALVGLLAAEIAPAGRRRSTEIVFAGLLFAFSIESKVKGQTVSQIVLDKIELDTAIEDSIFKMPAKPAEKPKPEEKKPPVHE